MKWIDRMLRRLNPALPVRVAQSTHSELQEERRKLITERRRLDKFERLIADYQAQDHVLGHK